MYVFDMCALWLLPFAFCIYILSLPSFLITVWFVLLIVIIVPSSTFSYTDMHTLLSLAQFYLVDCCQLHCALSLPHTQTHTGTDSQAHETCGIIIENTSNNNSPSLSLFYSSASVATPKTVAFEFQMHLKLICLNCLAKPKPKFTIGFDTFKNVFCIFGALPLVF